MDEFTDLGDGVSARWVDMGRTLELWQGSQRMVSLEPAALNSLIDLLALRLPHGG